MPPPAPMLDGLLLLSRMIREHRIFTGPPSLAATIVMPLPRRPHAGLWSRAGVVAAGPCIACVTEMFWSEASAADALGGV